MISVLKTKKPSSHYFDTQRKINALKTLSLEGREPFLQAELIKDISTGIILPATELKNEDIYRARWNEETGLFLNVKDLIYPPPECAKKGRFNDSNQSIFYAALCELGTIIELRPDLNKLFTISQFKLTSKFFPLFFPLGIKNPDGEDKFPVRTKLNKAQKVVIDFLNETITKKNAESSDYGLSILIGKQLLNTSLIIPGGEPINAGIAYSSVESKLISNTTTRNLAMTPSFFHKYYSFHNAHVYVLTKEPDFYTLKPVNQATANENGDLNWTFCHEEMMERLSKGIFLF